MDNTKAIVDLLGIVEKSSLSRLKNFSKRDTIEILPVNDPPLVCAHWMALILLSGPRLRTTFKTHFMTEAAQFFASKTYQLNAHEVSRTRGQNFFREFCNLTAGHVKLILAANEIKMGVSLPALARGFDDIFYPQDTASVVRYWSLACEGRSVICSVHFDFYDSVEIIRAEGDHVDSVGDVDFL
jgi:hypothetical protein